MAQGNRVFLKRRTESRGGGYFSHQSRQTDSLMWKGRVFLCVRMCLCSDEKADEVCV